MLKVVIFLLFCLNSFANPKYKIVSLAEDHIVTPKNFVELYQNMEPFYRPLDALSLVCSVQDRDSIFTDYVLPENRKKSSLKVMIADDLYYYNGKKLVLEKRNTKKRDKFYFPYYNKIKGLLSTLSRKSDHGRELLERLITSPHEVYLRIGHKSSNFVNQNVFGEYEYNNLHAISFLNLEKIHYEEQMQLKKIGGKVVVQFNPYLFYNNEQVLALGHELYHAYDAVRGFFIEGIVFSDYLQTADPKEYRAVFFENLLRKDFGRKLKKKYGTISKEVSKKLESKHLVKSMIQSDEPVDDMFYNGKQVWIPNPCLNEGHLSDFVL